MRKQTKKTVEWFTERTPGGSLTIRRDVKLPCKESLLKWQKMGLMYTASGYGAKIPTSKMVLLLNRWRRIYCDIYSNSGVCYIIAGGNEIYIDDCNLQMIDPTIDYDAKRFENVTELLLERLPHGSGINGQWVITIRKDKTVVATNTFHFLNENGYYDGYTNFSVIFPLFDGLYSCYDYRLVAHGWNYKTVKYWADGGYRDYVDQSIYNSLPETF